MLRTLLWVSVAPAGVHSFLPHYSPGSSSRLAYPDSSVHNEVAPRSVRPAVVLCAKKKGPAASFDLDALEALESQLYNEPVAEKAEKGGEAEEEDEAGEKKAKKKKKERPKAGEATLAAIEELEAQDAAEAEATGGKKNKKKKGKKGGGGAEDEPQAKKKDKKKDKKKGKNGAVEEEDEEEVSLQPVTEAEPEFAVPVAAEAEAEVSLEERVRKQRGSPRIQIAESSQPGYVSLRLDKINVVFKNQEVLTDASWEVRTGDRVGLVGANGCGKTTMVKILAGDMEPTSGDVIKSSASLRIAFLRQEFAEELDRTRTLREEFTSVFSEALGTLAKLEETEKRLESADASDAEGMQALLDEMQTLQRECDRLEAGKVTGKVDKVLDQMGFVREEAEALVASFSGGWKMRIGLGKILLQDPNILLLDEPTNHLDLESVEWLEKFLVQQNIPMVIVSHDREFMDNVCTKVVDTIQGSTYSYEGNYERFLKQKKARMDAWKSAYDRQQKSIKDERNWINQNKNKPATASAVKQRQEKLDKLLKGQGKEELVERPPNENRKFRFRFPPPPRISEADALAEIDDLTHGYPGNLLFKDVGLTVEGSDRIAFLGPNGCGKSTLLRCLVGKETPNEGSAGIGATCTFNYFEQNQADAMDLDDTVMGVIEKASTTESYEQLRALLGQFLFKGEEVNKKIRNLSGGEKARVALCRMMLTPANLLVLDEPTNHLDIPAKEILEEALQHYEGSMLLISHDRYFISQVATTIIAVEDKALEMYSGDYKYYLANRPELAEQVEARFIAGDSREIGSAKVVEVQAEDKGSRKKSFGGGGGPSGNKDKGVKNAKRMN